MTTYVLKFDGGESLAQVWNVRVAAVTAQALADAYQAPVQVFAGTRLDSIVQPREKGDSTHV